MAAKPTSAPAHQPPDLSSLCIAITEHAPLPMATVEGAGHIVRYVNPAFCRLMDKPKDELVGKPFREMLPEKDECVTLLDRVFRTGKPESHTEQEHSKPHPVFWSYTMWPVLADERPVGVMIQVTETAQFHERTLAMNEALTLGSLRQHELTEASENLNAQLRVEIAERNRTEEALHRAQAQLTDRAGQLEWLVAERTAELTATNKQLEAFVYSIAHDLRAPLRSMQGFSAMLMEEAGSTLSETGRDFAHRISRSAQFMDAMLTDLLTFSAIAQQRVELTSVNLESVVEFVLSRLEKEIQERNARIETVGPWPNVLGQDHTLDQVLANLVSNALKFVAPDRPPQIRLRAEEGPERINGLMDKWISEQSSTNPTIHSSTNPAPGIDGLMDKWISEPGAPSTNPTIHSSTNPPPPGIHSSTHPPLPPPPAPGFVRVWVEDNGIGIAPDHQDQIFRLFTRLYGEKYPGTGIGLAIVEKGIERMGGRAGVESTPGQGSRFWFELRKANQNSQNSQDSQNSQNSG